jgi:hypothetical protein
MRRLWLNAGVSAAALWLGVVAFQRGQRILGICFLAIAVLRAVATLAGRRRSKPQPSIRLNIEDSTDGKR